MSISKRLVFAVITNIILLGGLEVAARWATPNVSKLSESPVEFVGHDQGGPFPTELDPQLFWRVPSNAKIPDLQPCLHENANSQGYRGREFNISKAPGVKRVVLLGDSNTFGMGVEGDELYAHRLSRWLETAKDTKWEVINTATPGYSSFQMLQMLRTRAAKFSPDIVVIYAGAWNDYTPAIGTDDESSLRQFHERLEGSRGIFSNLYLFRAICNLADSEADVPSDSERKPSKQELYRQLWSAKQERPDGPRLKPEDFRRILTSLARESKQLGAKVIFIIPPAPFTTRSRFKDGDLYAQIVTEVAAAEADAKVDARKVLWTETARADAEVFCDIIHPSPQGHALIARSLANTIKELNVPGLPAEVPDTVANPPFLLKSIQSTADHYIGDPFIAAPADAAVGLDAQQILLPSPGKIVFKNVTLPANPSIRCDLAFFTRDDPKQMDAQFVPDKEIKTKVTFELRVEPVGGPSKLVFSETEEGTNAKPWAGPFFHRIDIGEFGGQPVNLIFETKGASPYAGWGRARIYSYR
ncbi:MAG: SGNH/GDSL hydrolase family protein [Planctomycetota bacterium]